MLINNLYNQYLKYGKNSLNTLAPRILSLWTLITRNRCLTLEFARFIITNFDLRVEVQGYDLDGCERPQCFL